LYLSELENKTREELQDLARDLGVHGTSTMKKQDLVFRLLEAQTVQQGNLFTGGILDVVDDGYGFLRGQSCLPGPNDVYVSQTQIRRLGLRTGDMITGQVRPPKESEKYHGLLASRP